MMPFHVELIILQGDSQLHFVLIAGEPINEPIVQHGEYMHTSDKYNNNYYYYCQGLTTECILGYINPPDFSGYPDFLYRGLQIFKSKIQRNPYNSFLSNRMCLDAL